MATDWETRYYEARALHTESNGMLTDEARRLREKNRDLREILRELVDADACGSLEDDMFKRAAKILDMP